MFSAGQMLFNFPLIQTVYAAWKEVGPFEHFESSLWSVPLGNLMWCSSVTFNVEKSLLSSAADYYWN